MTGHAPTVAITSTHAMVRAAESRGIRVDDLLDEHGVARSMLTTPEARLGLATALSIWDRLCERTGDPALQLVAPTHLPFGAYGIVDYLVDASSTVGEAIHRFSRVFRLIVQSVAVEANDAGNEPFMGISTRMGGAVPPIYVDYTLAALVGRIRMHIRPSLSLNRVELARSTPPDPAPYERTFNAPVRFSAPADRIYFTWEEWQAPTEHGDDYLVQLLERHATILEAKLPNPGDGIISQVRQAILEAIPENPTASDVARSLHVSTRTLQRRLARAGMTFSEVVEDVLAELAKDYLSDAQVPIVQVAFLLGFSEQSSFHRAFRRWTGMPPGQWREEGAWGSA